MVREWVNEVLNIYFIFISFFFIEEIAVELQKEKDLDGLDPEVKNDRNQVDIEEAGQETGEEVAQDLRSVTEETLEIGTSESVVLIAEKEKGIIEGKSLYINIYS